LHAENVDVVIQQRGIPQEFLEHASRGELLADMGLTAQDLARGITATVATMQSTPLTDDITAR
jgi:1-deoxy-D-xylulose-5-phosphate synthase